MDNSQLMKGILEGCILKIISFEETYGYKITEKINESGFTDVAEGTVYPLLVRLEKKGLLDTRSVKSPLGPKRKYFKLNEKGKKYLFDFTENWNETMNIVEKILKGGN